MLVTSSATARRAGRNPALLVSGVVVGGLTGAALAGIVVGVVIGRTALWAGGVGLVVLVYGAGFVFGAVRQARRPVAEKITALARIESRRATSGDAADVPLALDLTVAPDEGARFRAGTTKSVNLVDLPEYPEGGIVVVQYRADEPWKITVLTRPAWEWQQRAAEAVIEPAPETTRVTDPDRVGAGYCLLGVAGLLVGAAVVVLLLRGPLFQDDHAPNAAPATGTTRVDTSTLTTLYSQTTASMLSAPTMRGIADSFIAAGTPSAITVRIEEHRMTLNAEESGAGAVSRPQVDLRTFPFERVPALVHQAESTLGVHDLDYWRVDADRSGPANAVRVVVTVSGKQGSASLQADANGHITKRDPR
jgi:hypothetical protein